MSILNKTACLLAGPLARLLSRLIALWCSFAKIAISNAFCCASAVNTSTTRHCEDQKPQLALDETPRVSYQEQARSQWTQQ
jgi:hypothetical protein